MGRFEPPGKKGIGREGDGWYHQCGISRRALVALVRALFLGPDRLASDEDQQTDHPGAA
jgi:hypothetical protein